MDGATILGLLAAVLAGLGTYGLVAQPTPLRKLVAFNVLGNGVFLLMGTIARRGAGAGLGGDPVPQALVITGIVVAFAATALTVALILRLHALEGARDAPQEDVPPDARGASVPPEGGSARLGRPGAREDAPPDARGASLPPEGGSARLGRPGAREDAPPDARGASLPPEGGSARLGRPGARGMLDEPPAA